MEWSSGDWRGRREEGASASGWGRLRGSFSSLTGPRCFTSSPPPNPAGADHLGHVTWHTLTRADGLMPDSGKKKKKNNLTPPGLLLKSFCYLLETRFISLSVLVHKSMHARLNNVKFRFQSAVYTDKYPISAGLSVWWWLFPHSLIFPLTPATHADIYKYNSYKKSDASGTIC